jgi:preprotein translocase SecE subunit
MSVAEQTATEKIPRSPEAQLAGSSFLGAWFVLASLGLIFSFLPTGWHQAFAGEPGKELLNPFLSGALLIMVSLAAMVGIGLLGYWLDKTYHVPGLRAGSVFGAMSLFFIGWITLTIGNYLDTRHYELGQTVNISITLIFPAVTLFGLVRLYLVPGFRAFLIALEGQGWFSATSFKPNQGHKVRRATIAGILTIGICGIYTMVTHRSLGSGLNAANDWFWWIPFMTTETAGGTELHYWLPLIYKVHLVVPLLLSIALLWFAWRIVNWPTFADFLIATEAEINKVSWTTRKRLYTDTIVVLVTVFFLTTYLFIVDIVWIQVLSNRIISVLYVDIRGEQQKQLEKTLW